MKKFCNVAANGTAMVRSNVQGFCEQPGSYMKKHGANLAGGLWNTGDAVQFVAGAVTLSPRILLSSFVNVCASSSSMIFGKKDWGVALNGGLAILGTGIFLLPHLLSGDPQTWVGYSGFCAAVSFGIFSKGLLERFEESKNVIARNILGCPRRTMGSALLLSRMPIIVSAALHDQWTVLAPFVVWSLGDACMALSREEQVNKRKIDADLKV